jgi:hypothetical protein
MKKEHDALTLANLELDRRLLNELMSLGVVQTQSELGKLCGKNASYYACMRHKGFGMKIGSLTFLAARFSKMVADENDGERCIKLRLALQVIKQTIDEKCRLREIELNAY